MKRFGGHHGTQKAPKMDPQIVFLATQMEQQFDEFGPFFRNRVQMPLGAFRKAIWEPKWSQVGSFWGSERMANKCKSRNATIRTRAVDTRHLLHAHPDAKERALHVLALPSLC